MAIRLCPGRNGKPCGAPVPPPVGMGRPAEYCVEHKARPSKPRRLKVADAADAPPSMPSPTERPRPLPAEDAPAAEVLLYPSTLATLEAAGAVEHWAGQAALATAQRIDGCDLVGSPYAAMIKAHRDSMRAALDDSATETDALDSVFSRTS